jgi:hypothetical protein
VPTERAMWTCKACGRSFANRNQTHTCGLHSLDSHFRGKSAEIRAIYDAFVAMLKKNGPVTVLPEKTRIAFHVRMSFAQLTPKQGWIDGHFVLARAVKDPAFRKVETFSPRNHLHHFRLERLSDVKRLRAFATEAYAVGRQEHLRKAKPGG